MKTIRCPYCKKETVYDPSNASRPFCSERCQVLDLGAWADESYKVPVEESVSPSVNKNQDDHPSDDEPPPKRQLN
jgi:uncharacterized protein